MLTPAKGVRSQCESKWDRLDGDGFTIMFVTVRVPGSLIHYFADAAICKGGGIGLTSVYFFDVVRGPGVSGPEGFASRPSPQPKNNRQYFWARVGGRVWSETIWYILFLNFYSRYSVFYYLFSRPRSRPISNRRHAHHRLTFLH
jgi:hypothetical protein